mgnify:CR=1 FL=1
MPLLMTKTNPFLQITASTLLKLDLSGLQYVPHSIREDPGEANVIIKTIADNCPSLTWLSIASNRSITTTGFSSPPPSLLVSNAN